ncbi:WD40 repeat-like protein, partial [Auricularia subglabra TFB-10046 SS5]
HEDSIRGIAISPDSQLVVTASDDCTLVVWTIATRTPLRRLRTRGIRALGAAFSPDAQTVVCALFNGKVGVWGISAPGKTDDDGYESLTRVLSCHSDSVRAVAYAPDGRYLVSASDDTTLAIWDAGAILSQTEDAACCIRVLRGHTGWVRTLSFSPTGDIVASGSDDGSVRLWNVASEPPGPVATIQWERNPSWLDRIMAVAFSPSGDYVAVASLGGVIRVLDAVTHRDVAEMQDGHDGAVTSLAFAPDETHVVTGANDGTIR